MSNNKTNFEKVQEFNRAFDMVEPKPSNYNSFHMDKLNRIKFDPFNNCRFHIFEKEPETVKLRLALIKEEINELITAVKDNNIIEQRDACGDILYVVYGMADVLGLNIDDIFRKNIELD
jgi:predicted HAD superfamily Cof-like phosphohydrolase